MGRETHRGKASNPWTFALGSVLSVAPGTSSRIAEQVNVERTRQKSDIVSGVFANLISRWWGVGGYLHYSAGT